jgi:hypothetical protein
MTTTAEKTKPVISEEAIQQFTAVQTPHVELGQSFATVPHKFLGASAIKPLRFGEDFGENQESFVIGTFSRVASVYDFLQELNLDASASFSTVGAGASGSLNFARSVKLTRDSFFIAAHLMVGKSVQKIQHATFTDDARKKLAANVSNGRKQFLEAFGDEYCSAVHWGGRINRAL